MRIRPLLFLLVALLLAAGCTQESPPIAGPTTAAQPAATLEPTSQPSATSTVAPSATPAPSNTPPPSATPRPTRTPTPEPLLLTSAEDFGNDRNPLTGELVSDPNVLQRRPIAVKISNHPGGYVRPQAGLSQADLVFEHITEANITRFTAVFYDETPPDVGPIRSGRLIDLEIPLMYDAAFAYSGSSIGVAFKLSASTFNDRILRTGVPGYYRTGEDKPYEHTLYADMQRWYEVLDERELNVPPQFNSYMAFSEEPPEGGEPAGRLYINYRDVVTVDWEYDEASGRYLRWTDGEEHRDKNNDQQLSAANVVLIFAQHQTDYSICERQVGNECYAFSEEIFIWGEGEAIILRDGQQFPATWVREQRNEMLTFVDGDGNPVPLQIGNTWFQVLPTHYEDPVTIEP